MIALYARVSVADRGGLDSLDASRSIVTQEAELRAYVNAQPCFAGESVRVFVDDGVSGTREGRTGLQRMLRLAEEGKVSCVVVRDLSRLARSYVYAGRMLLERFPQLGVRVVSISDGYDSQDADSSVDKRLLLSVMCVLNESYSYMVSERVQASVRLLWSHGKHFGPNVPFGYAYDKEARGYLRADSDAAEIVRRVFELAASGLGPCAIARRLNSEGVVTPGEYRVRRGLRKAGGEGGSAWSAGKVSAILDCEAYVGTLVAGKRTRSKVGAQTKVECAPGDWVRVEDAWEPLVTKELFDRAQKVLRPRNVKP